jgi:hypothetical protein
MRRPRLFLRRFGDVPHPPISEMFIMTFKRTPSAYPPAAKRPPRHRQRKRTPAGDKSRRGRWARRLR